MDSIDVSSLNELLGRNQAMGITNGQPSVYDLIGLKPDDSEIHIPPITHLVATIEDPAEGSPSQPPELRTVYVRVSDHRDCSSSSESGPCPGKSSGSIADSAHDLESVRQCPVDNPDPEPGVGFHDGTGHDRQSSGLTSYRDTKFFPNHPPRRALFK